MPTRLTLVLATVLLGLAIAGTVPASDRRVPRADVAERGTAGDLRAMRVLFVGNSHTATHALPDVAATLAGPRGVTLEVAMLAEPGHSLGDHLAGGRLREALEQADWDWVVLQQGPSSRPASRVDLIRSATRIADALRGRPARIALMSAWPHRRDRASSLAAEESYRQAAAAIDACVLPVATAWRLAGAADGAPRLYQRDHLHATRPGTVLAALTVIRGLIGPDPVEPGPPALSGELQLLRQLAARAHRDEQRRCVQAPPSGRDGQLVRALR